MGSGLAEEAGWTNTADMGTSTSKQTALSGMPVLAGPPGMADLTQLAAPLGAMESGPWPAPLHMMESTESPGVAEGQYTEAHSMSPRTTGAGVRAAEPRYIH